AQGIELFMQAVVAPVPERIVWVDAKKDVPGRAGRRDVHDRGVLPALLLRIIKLIDGRTPIVQFVIIERRRNCTHHRKKVRALEREAQGALTVHAESMDRNGRRAQPSALGKIGEDRFQQVGLRADPRIEAWPDAAGPPGGAPMWTYAGQTEVLEPLGKCRPGPQGLQCADMQVQYSKAGRSWW